MTEPLACSPQPVSRRGFAIPDDISNHAARIARDLDHLERTFARQYFRLLRAEERLAVAGARPGAGYEAELDDERARIARELHSGAGQALAAIKLNLELLDTLLPDVSDPPRATLLRIGSLAGEALEQVRGVAHRVHPPDWERLTFAAAIERLWVESGIPERYQAVLRAGSFDREPPDAVRRAVYRAAQVAISNIIRHSGASRVRLDLKSAGGRVTLEVEDDGHGFDTADPANASGLGLRSTREHVRKLGGEITVRSGPGGTLFCVAVPL